MNKRIELDISMMGWPQRILFGVLAVAIILLGMIFGVVILGLGLVAFTIIAVRLWWMRRQLRHGNVQRDTTNVDGSTIDGSYEVVRERYTVEHDRTER